MLVLSFSVLVCSIPNLSFLSIAFFYCHYRIFLGLIERGGRKERGGKEGKGRKGREGKGEEGVHRIRKGCAAFRN